MTGSRPSWQAFQSHFYFYFAKLRRRRITSHDLMSRDLLSFSGRIETMSYGVSFETGDRKRGILFSHAFGVRLDQYMPEIAPPFCKDRFDDGLHVRLGRGTGHSDDQCEVAGDPIGLLGDHREWLGIRATGRRRGITACKHQKEHYYCGLWHSFHLTSPKISQASFECNLSQ